MTLQQRRRRYNLRQSHVAKKLIYALSSISATSLYSITAPSGYAHSTVRPNGESADDA